MSSKRTKNKELNKHLQDSKILKKMKSKDLPNLLSPDRCSTISVSQSLPSDTNEPRVLQAEMVQNDTSTKMESLRAAFEVSQTMKRIIKEEIEKIKNCLKKNEERQTALKQLMMEDKEAKMNLKAPSTVRAISIFAAPYFRDVKRMFCPLNDDAKYKRSSHDVNAYLNPTRPWHRNESKSLLDGVTAYALASALKKNKFKRDHLRNKLKTDKDITDEEIVKLSNKLAEIEKEIKEITVKPLEDLLDEVKGKIDWMTISSVNLQGCRTPEDCEYMWNNFLDFHVNKESYTAEEDGKIKQLANHCNERNWDTIAEHLQTNRTAIQCFVRYQEKLNPNLCKKYWTPEEDETLIRLVNELRIGTIIPWNKISLCMEGRTRQQVINRYERSISQLYNRGPWTPEEDAILLGCVSKFGSQWAKMKPFFKKRSTYAIRERYVNTLDPTIKLGSWSQEEDNLLITMVKRHGFGKWAKICKEIPGRTDNMCLVRANRLLEHSVKFHNKKGKDYDIDVNDPELFTSIIKPVAPTKILFKRSSNLKQNRDAAYRLFIGALEKIDPSFKVEDDPEDIDYNLLPLDTLHRVSEELHHKLDLKQEQALKYMKTRRFPAEIPPLDSDEIEDEEFQEETEVISAKDKEWTYAFLNDIFQMTGKILLPSRKANLEFNNREMAESTLYKAFLYKVSYCKSLVDEDDDLENVIFNGIDFSETMLTVVNGFVQPPVYSNQFIVAAPNMTTLYAMEIMQATLSRMKNMSNLVRYSMPYMKYLCERENNSPKCLQCLYKQGAEIKARLSPNIMLSDMKEKLFAVDEKMEQSAHVESACLRSCTVSCSCEAIAKSRESLRLMRQRFIGLFLWPALLSSKEFNEKQHKLLLSKPLTEKEKNYFLKAPGAPLSKCTGDCRKRVFKRGKIRRNTKTYVRKSQSIKTEKTPFEPKKAQTVSEEASSAVSNEVSAIVSEDAFAVESAIIPPILPESASTVKIKEVQIKIPKLRAADTCKKAMLIPESENISFEEPRTLLLKSNRKRMKSFCTLSSTDDMEEHTPLRRSKRQCVLRKLSTSFNTEIEEEDMH